MDNLKKAAEQYVIKRHKNSDNQKRFNETACEDDFVAGAKYKFITKKEFIKCVSKKDETFEDEFKAEFNSPSLMWNFIKSFLFLLIKFNQCIFEALFNLLILTKGSGKPIIKLLSLEVITSYNLSEISLFKS